MTTMTEREAEELSAYIRELSEHVQKNNDKAFAKRFLESIGINTPEDNDRKLYNYPQQALTVAE
ncbi:hypothetical protein [Chitinophaga tropicalis]|uniref:Uncharacterized protein n=1 Tax=Chitinophaga tropicalis TaxID=2683588 RepID=A0A7K1U8Z0_9BACT|nr:hypothetical protein [Chitinophaga tropicalis]MVT10823.1 hypothetical protein [Chitinophaga tropicalis]